MLQTLFKPQSKGKPFQPSSRAYSQLVRTLHGKHVAFMGFDCVKGGWRPGHYAEDMDVVRYFEAASWRGWTRFGYRPKFSSGGECWAPNPSQGVFIIFDPLPAEIPIWWAQSVAQSVDRPLSPGGFDIILRLKDDDCHPVVIQSVLTSPVNIAVLRSRRVWRYGFFTEIEAVQAGFVT